MAKVRNAKAPKIPKELYGAKVKKPGIPRIPKAGSRVTASQIVAELERIKRIIARLEKGIKEMYPSRQGICKVVPPQIDKNC
jgi:hypothetical protein